MKAKLQVTNLQDVTDMISAAVLCSFQSKCWSNSKKIPTEKFSKITNSKLSKRLKHNKELIDKKALENIHSIITKCRNIIKSFSLPFPIESVYMIPKELIEGLADELNKQNNLMEEAVEEFASDYDEFISEAEEELGKDLFDPNDYPKDIRDKFGIKFSFLEISVPTDIKKVSPKLYKQEIEKFRNTLEQARNDSILYLRNIFIQEVKDIVSILTGKTSDGKEKRIRQDTIEKFDKIFEMFKTKNIFQDNEFLKIIEDTKNLMIGVEASDLRTNEKLKEVITNELKKIGEIAENSVVSFKRKISF